MLGRLSRSIPDALLQCEMLRPTSFPAGDPNAPSAPARLLVRLLADALAQTDLGPRMRRKAPRTGPGSATRAQVVAARRWLLGELDDQVALPIGWVCDVLGVEHDVLAAAVRGRASAS